MNASALTPGTAREQALEGAADALRRVADALHLLAVTGEPGPGPRLVVSGPEPGVMLTVREAAALLKCSPWHIDRMVKGQPCRRKLGRKVLIERAGLLALLRRG